MHLLIHLRATSLQKIMGWINDVFTDVLLYPGEASMQELALATCGDII